MNQPPGQAGPSGPPEGAPVPGLFATEQVAQIAQIVAIATRRQYQLQPPPPPPREVFEEPGRSIERVQMSHPDSRPDPIGGSEPSSGCENIYCDSLPA